jgi:hypothetical protein
MAKKSPSQQFLVAIRVTLTVVPRGDRVALTAVVLLLTGL